ncbi:MAG: T9SS type A sorting domain-containing protein [Taibaiella sp.]|nr:T9SS type A sorting domain-containing protein [Taibaiella sp.]
MKQQILCSLFGLILHLTMLRGNAQVSQGGLPLSLQESIDGISIPVSYYLAPDWEAQLAKEHSLPAETTFFRSLVGGLIVATDFGFPQSGSFSSAKDGSMVWQGIIHIDNAPAIGLLFDQFHLPKGVKLYLANGSKKQVAGAFDSQNNDISGKFAIDVVQGSDVWIELNIAPGVVPDDIFLHIDRAMVMHRGIEHLAQYSGYQPIDQMDDDLNGQSSVCTINAICPQGAGYAANRKATVQTVQPVGNLVELCSGTLVNNTANTLESCKPLLLTAGHCEGTGSMNSDDFAQVMVRFNFERSTCDYSGATNGVTMTGVYIRARSVFNGSFPINDFMVYELRQAIPASYDVVLSGWNKSDTVQQSVVLPEKFIGFHHPAGDNKKLSTSQQISGSGGFWNVNFEEGYASGGSSGSGLFDGDGLLIGIASFAGGPVQDSCRFNALNEEVWTTNGILYQKLSYSWEYMPQETAANRRLKPWLDPLNTGVTQLGALSGCISTSTGAPSNIEKGNDEFGAALSVFPNPSIDGLISLRYNLKKVGQLQISVIDLNGKIVFKHTIINALFGVQSLNMQSLANGMYMVKIAGTTGFTTKKLMIHK